MSTETIALDSRTRGFGIDGFTLKLVAIIGMIVQHAAMVLRDWIPLAWQIPMHIAGGLTYAIMAYLVSEGYKYTSNKTKYLLRVLVFGIISQLPFAWALGVVPFYYQLNIMFNIFLGILLIHAWERIPNRDGNNNLAKPLSWVLFALAAIVILAVSFFTQFFAVGVLMIFLYHIIRNERHRRIWPGLLAVIFLGGIVDVLFSTEAYSALEFLYHIAMAIGFVISLVLLHFYNGQRGRGGKFMKWFFYAFYPAHFLLLIGLRWLLER